MICARIHTACVFGWFKCQLRMQSTLNVKHADVCVSFMREECEKGEEGDQAQGDVGLS